MTTASPMPPAAVPSKGPRPADATETSAKRTLASIGWVYVAFLVEKLSTLGTTAVLARILTPSDFGLIASALLVIGLISTFRDLGVIDAVIYFDDRPRETADSSFWIHTALGAAQMVLLIVLAPSIALMLGQGEAFVTILWAMSPALLVGSFGLTHNALLHKRLLFARRAMVDVIAATCKAAFTVALAWMGWEVWALVAGFLFGIALRTIALWIAVAYRPQLRFARDRALDMLRYGKHIVANNVAGSFAVYVDQVVILSSFGREPLAYYFIAARIPDLVIYPIARVLTAVLFPTISNLKNNIEKVRTFVVEATRVLSYAIFPIGLGLAATAEPLLETVFGATWLPGAPFLVVLSLVGMVATTLWVIGDGLKAIGRPDIMWRITLAEIVFSTIAILVLVELLADPIGACLGVLAAITFANVLRLVAARRLLDLPAGVFLRACAPAAFSAVVMCAAVLALDRVIDERSAIFRLSIEVLLGMAIYGGLLALIDGARLRRDYQNFRGRAEH
jgi:PST family polysaccharide transporter